MLGFDRTTLAAWTRDWDAERMTRYREYLSFYGGEQWNERRRAGESRLVVNYARGLVLKGVSYLFPQAPAFKVLDDQGDTHADSERVEGLLSEIEAENDLGTLDFQTALDAAVVGDGAFKVTWSKRLGRPVIAGVDPQGLYCWWWPDNPRELYRVIQRMEMRVEEAEMIYGVGRERYGASTGRSVVVVEDWTREQVAVEVGGLVVRRTPNPYPWIPFVVFPNVPRPHEFWGASDLQDLLEVCREINRRFTTVSRILHVSGYPITVLENVTGSEGIRAEAGAIWELPEDSKAYLLDMLGGGGIALHVEYIEKLYRALHDLSETPRTAFGDSGRSLSGVALEVEIQPLVQKVMRKRRVWDAVYRRRNAMVLDLLERFGGREVGGLRRTAVVWPSVLPSDRDALVTGEVQLVGAGIHSRKHAAQRLGDDDPAALFAEVLEEMRALGAMPPPGRDERRATRDA